MSFILDALKKSESDRQRQSGPSLFEVKVAPPRRALPVWAVVVAALLAINVIVISWMLLRHPAAQQPAAPASAQTSPPAVAASRPVGQDTAAARAAAPPSISASALPGPEANTTSPSAGAAAQQAAGRAAPSENQAAAAAPTARGAEQSAGPAGTPAGAGGDPSDTAPAVEPGSVSGSGGPQDAAGDLPLYQQIVGSAGLPDLHLDLHVFAARPQDRFVMINMHRLGEGDSLPSGARVEAIRPDGVVLSYHGTRFLLPRN